MPNIDFTQAISAAASLNEEIKAACSTQIHTAVGRHTLENAKMAALTGALSKAEQTALKEMQAWIEAMLMTCRAGVTASEMPNWPELPESFAALKARF